MENKMKDLANILGVELYEEFSAEENPSMKFRFTKQAFEYFDHSLSRSWGEVIFCQSLIPFIAGDWTVKKVPWKPKEGGYYWSVSLSLTGKPGVYESFKWSGNFEDYSAYYIGNCFRTKEEAIKHKDEILNKLVAKYEEDK